MTRDPAFLRSLAKLLGPDWTYIGITGRGHLRFRHRDGCVMITNSNAGDSRAVRNILATAKRLAGSRSGSPSSREPSGS